MRCIDPAPFLPQPENLLTASALAVFVSFGARAIEAIILPHGAHTDAILNEHRPELREGCCDVGVRQQKCGGELSQQTTASKRSVTVAPTARMSATPTSRESAPCRRLINEPGNRPRRQIACGDAEAPRRKRQRLCANAGRRVQHQCGAGAGG